MNCFTRCYTKAILHPLSQKTKAGLGTPFERGQKMTAPFAVFFRLQFSATFSRAYSVMAGCIGQPLRLAAPRCGSSNLIQPATQSLEPLCGGLSSLTRTHRMNSPTQRANCARNSQDKYTQNLPNTPLFSLFAYRRPIAQNITGTLAVRFKRRYPACIVKFSGFEGGAQ